jgi:formate dehydrogenase subunit delta
MQAEKLVRMANQIAANFDYGPDKAKAAAAVADHLRRFWSPLMREEIVNHDDQGEVKLSDVAKQAVAQLALEQSSAT